ncbi:EAL domain-containing protein [Rhizobium sp. NFR03]|uniref:putative bifunctional diguanylate cyclase/phosphodiesterase n=1 Tax=Rhizobium sp. NFR03 TaxID=1566263 RepID=UPI0008B4CD9B|nr:EAL domain-containing protein [Rhizobium sp. NFR03]SES28307.1 PAS domain S-box-containing protein/diguanylate cyclase (GGDEF) domain-containing protein [Rhizobium sp. NFR03]
MSCRLPDQQDESLSRQRALEEKLWWHEALINNIPANLYVEDMEGRFIIGNRVASESYGLGTADRFSGKIDLDLNAHTFGQEVLSSRKALVGMEQEIVGADGRSRWMLTSRFPIKDANDAPAGTVGFAYDITDRKEAETLVLAQANMFGMVARSVPIEDIVSSIIVLVEAQVPGAIGSVQMLSQDRRHLSEPIAPNLPDAFRTSIGQMNVDHAFPCGGPAVLSGETVIVEDVQSDPVWRELAEAATTCAIRSSWSAPVVSYQGEVLGTFSLYTSSVASPTTSQSDIIAMASYMLGVAVERKQAEQTIQFMARHDALTGLPNRLTFHERLTSALELAKEQDGRVTLAFLDLDNFKLINDSLGHDAGDQLLKTIADRATCSIGRSDLIARLGGDEFVLLLTDPSPEGDFGHERLHDLRRTICEPLTLSGRSFQITFSMGVASFPEHGDTSAALLANADLAMYRAKACGRNNTQFFSPELAAMSNAKLLHHQQLRDAITGDQFVLHYQPQIDIDTGHIFAFEALVRWNHPDRGTVSPAEFIPLAEETGLIVPIGDWVLKTACQQNRAWQDAGFAPVVVSVNVSARQFGEPNWAARVAEILAESGLEARYLELELTESLIMQDLPKARAMMDELNTLGVRLAIDDFGVGYSSLSALKSLPVNRLKIDRSFVKDIPADAGDMAITETIIALAQKLGLHVVAEGVETQDQVDFLRGCGCREVQGYLFGRPMEAQECVRLLERVLSVENQAA